MPVRALGTLVAITHHGPNAVFPRSDVYITSPRGRFGTPDDWARGRFFALSPLAISRGAHRCPFAPSLPLQRTHIMSKIPRFLAKMCPLRLQEGGSGPPDDRARGHFVALSPLTISRGAHRCPFAPSLPLQRTHIMSKIPRFLAKMCPLRLQEGGSGPPDDRARGHFVALSPLTISRGAHRCPFAPSLPWQRTPIMSQIPRFLAQICPLRLQEGGSGPPTTGPEAVSLPFRCLP